MSIRSFFRDLKIAIQELDHLPYVLKTNPDDQVPSDCGELSILETTSVPGFGKSVMSYLVPIWKKQRTDTSMVIRHPTADGVDVDEDWYFVNGIMTTKRIAIMNASYLSRIFKRPINIIYNPSRGLSRDLGECILGRTFNKHSNTAFIGAQLLADKLRRGRRVVLIGHSQGGIISSNIVGILHEFGIKAEQLKLLEVYTFAGAQDELEGPLGVSEHFANEKDYVARIGVMRRDQHVHGETHVREDAVGHLLNEHYLHAFTEGRYCGGSSYLFKQIK